MQKKNTSFVPQADCKKQTPEVPVKAERQSALYEQAFLSREDRCTTEYALNTTTWD